MYVDGCLTNEHERCTPTPFHTPNTHQREINLTTNQTPPPPIPFPSTQQTPNTHHPQRSSPPPFTFQSDHHPLPNNEHPPPTTHPTEIEALLGEVMTTCEKIRTVCAQGEGWLKPEYRKPGPMMVRFGC